MARERFQEQVERTAHLSTWLLPSPPIPFSLLVTLLAGAAASLAFQGEGLLVLLSVTAPGLATPLLAMPLARVFRLQLAPRRATMMGAAGAATLAAALLVGQLVPLVPLHLAFFVGLGLVWAGRFLGHSIMTTDTIVQALILGSLQPILAATGALVLGLTVFQWLHGLTAVLLILAPVVLAFHAFSAPLQKSMGFSMAALFRGYLDHMMTEGPFGEDVLARAAVPADIWVGVLAIRRLDGSPKALVMVPELHPGPFGRLGGGDLPAKVAKVLASWEHVLVPHGAATHDLNPVSMEDVERVARHVGELAERATFGERASAGTTAGETARIMAQAFNDNVILAYTSHPEPLDDIDPSVAQGARLHARLEGAVGALFIDCHNSLRLAAGQVQPFTPRARAIQQLAAEAARAALPAQTEGVRAGLAQDPRSLGLEHLVGRQGCQALVIEAGGKRTAYILWDGNNMVPEATSAVFASVADLVDVTAVMTTDNHSVNVVGGVFSPVGLRAPPDALGRISRAVVERAIADLEPVRVGVLETIVPSVRVFGYQRTAQLVAAVNSMVRMLPTLGLLVLLSWGLGLAFVWTFSG